MKDGKNTPTQTSWLVRHMREPRLINITEGSKKRKILLSGGLLLIGRDSQADVKIEHPSISRNHASILKQGEAYCLRDNGSVNGSYVNGVQIELHRLHPLAHHDVVRFGAYTFLVDLGAEADDVLPAREPAEPPAIAVPGLQNDKNVRVYNLQLATAESKPQPRPADDLTIVARQSSAAATDAPPKDAAESLEEVSEPASPEDRFQRWKQQFGKASATEAHRLKRLEQQSQKLERENSKLKKKLAKLLLAQAGLEADQK